MLDILEVSLIDDRQHARRKVIEKIRQLRARYQTPGWIIRRAHIDQPGTRPDRSTSRHGVSSDSSSTDDDTFE